MKKLIVALIILLFYLGCTKEKTVYIQQKNNFNQEELEVFRAWVDKEIDLLGARVNYNTVYLGNEIKLEVEFLSKFYTYYKGDRIKYIINKESKLISEEFYLNNEVVWTEQGRSWTDITKHQIDDEDVKVFKAWAEKTIAAAIKTTEEAEDIKWIGSNITLKNEELRFDYTKHYTYEGGAEEYYTIYYEVRKVFGNFYLFYHNSYNSKYVSNGSYSIDNLLYGLFDEADLGQQITFLNNLRENYSIDITRAKDSISRYRLDSKLTFHNGDTIEIEYFRPSKDEYKARINLGGEWVQGRSLDEVNNIISQHLLNYYNTLLLTQADFDLVTNWMTNPMLPEGIHVVNISYSERVITLTYSKDKVNREVYLYKSKDTYYLYHTPVENWIRFYTSDKNIVDLINIYFEKYKI